MNRFLKAKNAAAQTARITYRLTLHQGGTANVRAQMTLLCEGAFKPQEPSAEHPGETLSDLYIYALLSLKAVSYKSLIFEGKFLTVFTLDHMACLY